MILVNDLKPGTTFESEGNIYSVLNIEHNKTAMRQMIVKVKVKTDDVVDQNVSATKVQSAAGICFADLVDAKS